MPATLSIFFCYLLCFDMPMYAIHLFIHSITKRDVIKTLVTHTGHSIWSFYPPKHRWLSLMLLLIFQGLSLKKPCLKNKQPTYRPCILWCVHKWWQSIWELAACFSFSSNCSGFKHTLVSEARVMGQRFWVSLFSGHLISLTLIFLTHTNFYWLLSLL